MSCYIVTEGPTDGAILRSLLIPPFGAADVRITAAGGRSSAVSLARTLLVLRTAPVGLVVDADTADATRCRELESDVYALLRAVGDPERIGVFVACPELEAVLFQDRAGIERIFDGAFGEELRVRSRYEPKQVIRQLLRRRGGTDAPGAVVRLMHKLDTERLRQAPLVEKIAEFVQAARQAAPV